MLGELKQTQLKNAGTSINMKNTISLQLLNLFTILHANWEV